MAGSALLLLGFLVLGTAVQRLRGGNRIRDGVWLAYFWTVTPLLVFVSFLTVELDERLALAVAATIVATWLVGALGYAYAAAATHERDERGALALAAGFPNTGFVGLPVAQLAFGDPGLALAVVYDRLSWLVPPTSVSTVVARLHGRRQVDARRDRPVRAALANPPLFAMAVALALRALAVDVPLLSETGSVTAAIVGPAGFFLLGLSLSLEEGDREAIPFGRAAGALVIRFAGGPAVLYAVGRLLGADVPGVFYLLAAMPSAFHLLVLARVYDVRPAMMRLLVVGSTLPAVLVVILVVGLSR